MDRFYTEVLQPQIVDDQNFPTQLRDLQVPCGSLTSLIVSGTPAQGIRVGVEPLLSLTSHSLAIYTRRRV